MRSRTRRQPATPLAELVDRSPRRRALGTVNGNAQENRPLPPTKALTKAPTKALPSPPTLPPVSEPPTLVSVMSMDVLSLIFEFMDDGRGPLSLATRFTRWPRSHSKRCTRPSIHFRRTPPTSASESEAAPALGCARNPRFSCSGSESLTSLRQLAAEPLSNLRQLVRS